MIPREFFMFLYLFHTKRDYFECHEILEDYWKKKPVGQRDIVWRVLIQLSVGLLHYRRHNYIGAKKLIKKARYHLPVCCHELRQLGIDDIRLDCLLHRLLKRLENKRPYTICYIPVRDAVKKKKVIWNYSIDE